MAKKKVSLHEPVVRTKRVGGAAVDIKPRSQRLLSTLEKQAEESFERLFVRLIWRLGLVSQKDVRGLSQRVDQLERHLRMRRPARTKSGTPRQSLAPSSSENGSSGNSTA